MRSTVVFCLFALACGKPTTNDPEYGDLWDGDIELVNGQVPPPSKFNAVWDKDLLWPNNELHYTITEDDYTEEEIALIEEGVRDLVDSTYVDGEQCIFLIRVPEGEASGNYVYVEDNDGCSSHVGMSGGAQRLSLTSSCIERHGTIMHEFLHALGFHHEHKRADRDDYVTIHWDNIEPGKEHNFEKLVEGETVDHLGTPYDYGSVMHYSETAFAIDPSEPTIEPHDPDAEIGQRIELSDLDIERVKILYGCLAIEKSSFKGMTMEEIFSPLN